MSEIQAVKHVNTLCIMLHLIKMHSTLIFTVFTVTYSNTAVTKYILIKQSALKHIIYLHVMGHLEHNKPISVASTKNGLLIFNYYLLSMT